MDREHRTALVRSRERVSGKVVVNIRRRTGGRVPRCGDMSGAAPVGDAHDQSRYREAPHDQDREPSLAPGALPAYFSDCHEFPIPPVAIMSLMTSCKLLIPL